MITVNTNIASSNAQRALGANQLKINQSFERLASARRVNSAGDDAAGLSISARMEAQIRGVTQAVGNANDATSMAQTADGAMDSLTLILQRMRELAVQAANEVTSRSDREAIQEEITQLRGEVDRIGTSTFNHKALFGNRFAFQLGADTIDDSNVNVSFDKVSNDRLGLLVQHTSTQEIDTSFGLANDDLVIIKNDGTEVAIRATDDADDELSTANQLGSAIAKASAINASAQLHGVTARVGETTYINSGVLSDEVLGTNDVLTINDVKITGISIKEFDADGTLVDAINAAHAETGVVATADGQGNITLTAEDGRNIAIGATGTAANLGFSDGAVIGAALTLESADTFSLKFKTGAVNTQALGQIAPSTTGVNDPLAGISHTAGTRDFTAFPWTFSAGNAWQGSQLLSVSGFFEPIGTFGDLTNSTFYVNFNNNRSFLYVGTDAAIAQTTIDRDSNTVTSGSSTFHFHGRTITLTYDTTNLDDDVSDRDNTAIKFTLTPGALGTAAAGEEIAFMAQNYEDTALKNIDVTTTRGAEQALKILDQAIDEVSGTRAELGGLQNRLESTANTLNRAKFELSRSKSQIVDADVASEAVTLAQHQIIQEAATSVLAQANSDASIWLSLL